LLVPAEIPVVILAGGQGTRIRDVSESLPKPMLTIGRYPVIWHIMKYYHHHGHRRFVLCLGYKSETIKQFFLNYRTNVCDLTLRADGSMDLHGKLYGQEDWEISMIYTGLNAETGHRLHEVAEYIDADRFMLTYGDGVADVDLPGLMAAHEAHGRIGTVTAVHPTSRFGELQVSDGIVTDFAEKPDLNTGLVNGGFMLFERAFLDYVHKDAGMLESNALQKLTADRQLGIHVHTGFWRGMDTYREYTELNKLWDTKTAPWRVW
jgi:glucose-1-phosphate cytidylyltransferase